MAKKDNGVDHTMQGRVRFAKHSFCIKDLRLLVDVGVIFLQMFLFVILVCRVFFFFISYTSFNQHPHKISVQSYMSCLNIKNIQEGSDVTAVLEFICKETSKTDEKKNISRKLVMVCRLFWFYCSFGADTYL